MTRDNEVYLSRQHHRILTLMAKKIAVKSSDKFTIDSMAAQIIDAWISANPEALEIKGVIERHRDEIERLCG